MLSRNKKCKKTKLQFEEEFRSMLKAKFSVVGQKKLGDTYKKVNK